MQGTNVQMGFSITDADAGWQFDEIVDYGGMNGQCHIGHPIRYGYIVRNPTNPQDFHVYGSDCICKFWIAQEYKTLDANAFTKLYRQYHPLFIQFGKLLYQLRKYGIIVPKFPQNLADLKAQVAQMKMQISQQKQQRKALWKAALKKYQTSFGLKRKQGICLKNNPDLVTLINNKGITYKLRVNPFLFKFATDLIHKFDTYGNISPSYATLSAKQLAILRQINTLLQQGGNPYLIRKFQQIVTTDVWLRDTFLPSLIKQLGYKNDLSPKQWEVLDRFNIREGDMKA